MYHVNMWDPDNSLGLITEQIHEFTIFDVFQTR